MTQPSTGPLCRDCKHSQNTDAGLWCHEPRVKFMSQDRALRCLYSRVDICGPDGKNFEAKP